MTQKKIYDNNLYNSIKFFLATRFKKKQFGGITGLRWDCIGQRVLSIRKMCDEAGLNWYDKAIICSTIECESGFRLDAINVNKNGSIDYGIIQANNNWYIGEGRPLANVWEAVNLPEKCVRIMINKYKHGGLNDWYAFRNGVYMKVMGKYLSGAYRWIFNLL